MLMNQQASIIFKPQKFESVCLIFCIDLYKHILVPTPQTATSRESSPIVAMASHIQTHFVLLPLMAPGHMNPMIDIARLLARRGEIVTIVTTTLNAKRIETIASGLCIRIVPLQFPSVAAGLPEGCENLDMIPSMDSLSQFFVATDMLQQPVEELLAELKPRPSCIISDLSFWWTTLVAQRFQIPRLVFHGTGCFALYVTRRLMISKVPNNVKSDSDYMVVPGLPHRVELTKAQLPGLANPSVSGINYFHERMKEAEKNAYGIVVNTFEELEMDYVEEFRKVMNKRVWCIGPVSLCNSDKLDYKAERGNKASVDQHNCLKWLASRETNSVIYVCLGSLSRLSTGQMTELALGLEASQRPFVWATRYKSGDFEKWLCEEKFEERINDRGLLIHGWAPQVLILSHPAVGGFVTHCGWNSTLEGISAGVPLITWPMFGEQFCNEKLIVNILRVGVRVGVEFPVRFGEEEKVGVQVKQQDCKTAIDELMSEEQEGKQRRERARKLGEMAKRALEEGGSSHLNLDLLVQDITEHPME
ncbi:UDP-glycosyltransferase 73C4-like [Coffea eugenioides]|uniref:UDP-glycosyltransferase 73C4-like n=1 Tax=Coffea eugenioides TaxID=49369 RepID=UPI000F615DAF|nr:UDP-glycosyltransferase 73C4-like [Coffea eugenioides]